MSDKKPIKKTDRIRSGNGNGVIFVVTAPSGAGKSSLCWAVIKRIPGLEFSVSHTTRPPRPNERDGVDYHFVDESAFDKMIEEDKFVEWASLYGWRYGTSIAELERARKRKVDLLIEIDRQGAKQVRDKVPGTVGIFILPPSLDMLKKRLNDRATESPEEIKVRLSIAADEAMDYVFFEYAVINDDFDEAVSNMEAIVRAERCRISRRKKDIEKIVNVSGENKAAD